MVTLVPEIYFRVFVLMMFSLLCENIFLTLKDKYLNFRSAIADLLKIFIASLQLQGKIVDGP